MQCANNMKQLGLALHNYHDTYKKFPYSVSHSGSITVNTAIAGTQGGLDGAGKIGGVLNHRGWLLMLPYIEQQNLQNQLNLNLATGSQNNRQGANVRMGLHPGMPGNANDLVVSQDVPAFLCPSDPNLKFYTPANNADYGISPNSSVRGGAFTNYDFSAARVSNNAHEWDRIAVQSRRMFGFNASASFQDITDGTSNAVAICETLRATWNGISATWGYSKWVGNGVDLAFVPTVTATPGVVYGNNINFTKCCAWDTPPHARAPIVRSRLGEWGTAGSMHPGGAQFTLGDGSVRFIAETTNSAVLVRLATISDDQPLGNLD
jgi:hypothetical protein